MKTYFSLLHALDSVSKLKLSKLCKNCIHAFALSITLVISQNLFAQTFPTTFESTYKDGYIVNNDNTNVAAVLRLNNQTSGWNIIGWNGTNNLAFNWAATNGSNWQEQGTPKMTLSNNGELQLTNAFSGTGNRRFVLYNGGNDHQFYGLGINYGTLRYQIDGGGPNITSHTFFAGTNSGSSTELMRIQSDGNVGIGTSTPQNKLHVVGTSYLNGMVRTSDKVEISFGSSPTNSALKLSVNGQSFLNGSVGIGTSTPSAQLSLGNSFARKKIVLWDNGGTDSFFGLGFEDGNGPAGRVLRYQVASNVSDPNSSWDHAFFTGVGLSGANTSTELFRIKANGNVGIGTNAPQSKLDVNGNINVNGVASVKELTIANKLAVSSFDAANNKLSLYGTGDHLFYGFGINPFVLRYQVSMFSSHIFYAATSATESKELLKIDYDGGLAIRGNAGVGTDPVSDIRMKVFGSFNVTGSKTGTETIDPTIFHVSSGKRLVFIGQDAFAKANPSTFTNANYSLWVSKGIVSEDYAIDLVNDWSDYVFNKDYKLSSLKEIEDYISANHHLPNFPSEAEVKKNGYRLHAMNQSFLKTIEEMTLHAIAQEKKIIEQEKKAQEQATKMNEQAKQLNTLAAELAEIKAMLKEK